MSETKTTRREFIKLSGAGILTVGVSGFSDGFAQADSKKRPNIILYVTDDQGTNDAGCYGNKVIKTPGLDELAKEGVVFTHAFCTTASCSASRSVILTGLFNHANGQFGHVHRYHHFRTFDNIQSLPVILSRAGYRTARWGKYHVGPEEVYKFEEVVKGGGSPAGGAEKCRAVIESESNKPFFLYFCTHEPHRPFKREGSDMFKPEDVIVPSYLPDIPECREELAEYYGSVQRADVGFLELIKILKDAGKWNNTVIIYCSDNGIAFPGAKTTLYEPGMRLPFVVYDGQANSKGITTDAMVSYVDITPTILDYAGVDITERRFHGRSFRSVVQSGKAEGFDEIYASHTFHEITMYYPMRVVRNRRYKLIWNIAHGLDYPFASDLWASKTWQAVLKRSDDFYGKRKIENYLHKPEFELYDLEKDPHEVKNLADDTNYANTFKEMKGKLKAFQKRTKDPWIVKWEYE